MLETADPALPLVKEWIANARNRVEMLPCDPADGDRTLLALQVTTRSTLGAIAHDSGGILVDGGWVRILGAGSPRLPRDLARWNGLDAPFRRKPGALLIGDDCVGGFFAANGGAFGPSEGHIHYLAPDSLEWEDTGRGYTEFLSFLLEGDLDAFYEGMRWKGWREEVAKLPGDRVFSIDPALVEPGPPIDGRTRKVVAIEETWTLHAADLPTKPS